MQIDPLTPWDGQFPYDRLRNAGITPQSTMTEVKDASFVLMEKGEFDADARVAWDALHTPENRLFVEFFLFDGTCSDLLLSAGAGARGGAPRDTRDEEASFTPARGAPSKTCWLTEFDGLQGCDPLDTKFDL